MEPHTTYELLTSIQSDVLVIFWLLCLHMVFSGGNKCNCKKPTGENK
jgi:hypothetical protein